MVWKESNKQRLKHIIFSFEGGLVDKFTRMMGPFLFVLMLLLLLSIGFVVMRYTMADFQLNPVLFLFQFSLGMWIAFNIGFNYLMTIYVDPGTTIQYYGPQYENKRDPRVDQNEFARTQSTDGRYKSVYNRFGQSLVVREAETENDEDLVDINSEMLLTAMALPMMSPRFCRKCNLPKPPRCHHCSVCRRCILKMDHHCPWMLTCVGFYNQKYFLSFLVYVFIGCLYSSLMLWPFLKLDVDYVSILILTSFAMSSIFSVVMFFFSAWSFYLAVKLGQTQYEGSENGILERKAKIKGKQLKYPYQFGWKKNMNLIFGGREWYQFLLPTLNPPPGNGVHFKTAFAVTSVNNDEEERDPKE